jgi:quercetin dioxygenase-like cupin family protein
MDRQCLYRKRVCQRPGDCAQDPAPADGPPGYQTVLTSVEIPAGVSEMRHTHPGMLVVYVIEGTLALETEGRARTTYKSGDSFHVEAGKVHQGINTGTVLVKLAATLVAEKGKPLSTPAP